MRDIQRSLRCYQFQLPLDKRSRSRGPRASSSAYSLRSVGSRYNLCSSSTSLAGRSSSHTRPQSRESHNCVSVSNKTHQQDSQHILVGSALRRPHATEYSPLDYQTMPNIGKAPQQPFRSQSSCTVYTYANRPVSACHVPVKHGKHTKASLLRTRSASSISSASSSGSSSNSRPNSGNKRLCQIRDDYRFFKPGSSAKQIPPHGESLHSFLTGARYNNARYLDSRTLSKLGVYIPKADLLSFFVKEQQQKKPLEDDEDVDDHMTVSSVSSEVEATFPDKASDERDVSTKAVNTDPHYLSIQRWHSAEWRTDRKATSERATRAHTAPCRIKPIKTYYHDYNSGQKYNIQTKTRNTSS